MWSVETLLGLEIQNFRKRLYEIAAKDTSADPENWHESNPLHGHCAIAALLFQDFFEGTLLSGKVFGQSHYWNVLPDGATTVDTTWEQFQLGPGDRDLITDVTARKQRDYVLSFPDTKTRYELLKSRYGS